MPDPVAVNSMFGRIAGNYDRANRLLSGGIDLWWRRRLVNAVRRVAPDKVLDLATGSGDVAFALAKVLPPTTSVLGADFCRPMLDVAEAKKNSAKTLQASISFQQADALNLPFTDGRFDTVTISFGLRNMADRHRSLSEMRRVLRPGGRLFVLEFSQPDRWFKPLYFFYLRHLLPKIAGAVTGDREAYVYLNDSIATFPSAEMLTQEIAAAQFRAVKARRLTFGIVALHEAEA